MRTLLRPYLSLLLILPVSSDYGKAELERIVKDVNHKIVAEQDLLGYKVQKYDRAERKLIHNKEGRVSDQAMDVREDHKLSEQKQEKKQKGKHL